MHEGHHLGSSQGEIGHFTGLDDVCFGDRIGRTNLFFPFCFRLFLFLPVFVFQREEKQKSPKGHAVNGRRPGGQDNTPMFVMGVNQEKYTKAESEDCPKQRDLTRSQRDLAPSAGGRGVYTANSSLQPTSDGLRKSDGLQPATGFGGGLQCLLHHQLPCSTGKGAGPGLVARALGAGKRGKC